MAKKELNWTCVDGITNEEMTPFDCLSSFMCRWNDYTQGIANNGPSRLYKYVSPIEIPSAFIAATMLLGNPSIKNKDRKRMVLAVAQMRTAIENFRHAKEIGSLPKGYNEFHLPYWKYLSQYTLRTINSFLEKYANDYSLDIFPKNKMTAGSTPASPQESIPQVSL